MLTATRYPARTIVPASTLGYAPSAARPSTRAPAPESASTPTSPLANVGAPEPHVLGSQPPGDGSSADKMVAAHPVVDFTPVSSTTSTPTGTVTPATRSVTGAQKSIRQPRVYTDGTVRYGGKHGFLTSNGEPHSVDDALTNSNWKRLWI
jgi:hypothetical protein